tara:strand:- start:9103 stop:9474 length:372 start_codon:yes stop_codon:yes gene_type:complete
MAQTLEAVFHQGNDQVRLDYTPSGAAVVNGEIIYDSGICYVCTSPEGIADGVLGDMATNGIFKIKKDAIDTFAKGAKVAWDDTANQAEPDGGGNDDGTLGIAITAAVAADDFVLCAINRTALV